ncbi:unnamed protein product [Closterium sp. Yama58-4]|nr:unnamed protein product [Closterium sp. Yama58-4]
MRLLREFEAPISSHSHAPLHPSPPLAPHSPPRRPHPLVGFPHPPLPHLPCVQPPRGITSADAATNPTFYNWHLVRPVYCDGGGFAGRAGYKVVGNGSEGVHMDGWRIIHAILGDLRTSRGMTAPARILLSGSSAGGQAVVTLCDLLPLLFPRALVKCIMDAGLFVGERGSSWVSGAGMGGSSGAVSALSLGPAGRTNALNRKQPHLTRPPIPSPTPSPTPLPTPVPTLPPTPDAEDRTNRRAFAAMVRATVGLHNMRVNWRCSQTMTPANQWQCFFPHRALRFVSSPVLAVNSLFDYRALMLGNQLPANQAQATACLRQIAREGGTDLLRLVTSQTWRQDRSALAEIQSGEMFPRGKGRKVRGSAGAAAAEAPVCAPEEHRAVLNVAWQMIQYTDAASLELGPTVSTFVTPAIAHCALTSPKWGSLMDKGVTLRDAVTTWYKRPL